MLEREIGRYGESTCHLLDYSSYFIVRLLVHNTHLVNSKREGLLIVLVLQFLRSQLIVCM